MKKITITIGPGQKPPPHPIYGDSYERGLDPWHADAFVGTPAEGAVADVGARKWGWYLIDGCGNVIQWVPDGTEMKK